jgi:hypothetical protein
MTRQRGMVLLPVTLALALVAALAYGMTRDGAMTASAVDAQSDIDNARYLAEAGVNLVRWRNEQAGCGSALGFTRPVTALDGGIISVSGVQYVKPRLAMTVTATTPRGAVNTVVFDGPHGPVIHSLAKKVEITLSAQGSTDTFLRKGMPPMAGMTYLEVTDNNANGLIKFGLQSVPAASLIEEATLRLTLYSIASTQPGNLEIHQMLRDWGPGAVWDMGWTIAGGDYVPQASATITNVLSLSNPSNPYTARIDSLIEALTNQPKTNYGFLLKGNGLVTARFNSFEASSAQPQLYLRYYPACS